MATRSWERWWGSPSRWSFVSNVISAACFWIVFSIQGRGRALAGAAAAIFTFSAIMAGVSLARQRRRSASQQGGTLDGGQLSESHSVPD